MLDGFELIPLVAGTPAISITEASISFNKTAVEKLSSPEYVQVLINRANSSLAVVPCSCSEEGARPFLKEGRNPKNGVRWNNNDLKAELVRQVGWDLSNSGKKIKGDYSAEDNALIFDLNAATVLPTRNRGGVDENS